MLSLYTAGDAVVVFRLDRQVRVWTESALCRTGANNTVADWLSCRSV